MKCKLCGAGTLAGHCSPPGCCNEPSYCNCHRDQQTSQTYSRGLSGIFACLGHADIFLGLVKLKKGVAHHGRQIYTTLAHPILKLLWKPKLISSTTTSSKICRAFFIFPFLPQHSRSRPELHFASLFHIAASRTR